MTIHISTSGWSYDHWTNVLYPEGMPPRDRLARYVEAVGTVELNASFYRWPRDASFASWRRRTPDGFVLSGKAPRGLTHAKRLYAPEVWAEHIARACSPQRLAEANPVAPRPSSSATARAEPDEVPVPGRTPESAGAAGEADGGTAGPPRGEFLRRRLLVCLVGGGFLGG